jgi:glutathionyl-hydroquinone reductase
MGANGWPFASVDAFPGAEADPLFGAEHVKDLYLRANPDYDRRFTVPFIWDKVIQFSLPQVLRGLEMNASFFRRRTTRL